eukprot:8444194-Pyramimonas_sp.AAC.2
MPATQRAYEPLRPLSARCYYYYRNSLARLVYSRLRTALLKRQPSPTPGVSGISTKALSGSPVAGCKLQARSAPSGCVSRSRAACSRSTTTSGLWYACANASSCARTHTHATCAHAGQCEHIDATKQRGSCRRSVSFPHTSR